MRESISRAATGLVLAAAMISGCGAQQRAAEKLIDPRLRSEGVLVERQASSRDLALGRYRVEQLRVDAESFDGSGPLAADADGRTRPTQQWRLEFSLVGGAAPWTVECVGQRRQPPDHDLAAAADEQRDEVAVHCQLAARGESPRAASLGLFAEGGVAETCSTPGTTAFRLLALDENPGARRHDDFHHGLLASAEQRFVLRIDGSLAANLLGRLDPAGAEQGGGKVVEIVMWHHLWNISRRHLPASLAVIRGDGGTEAALILDAPERAWLAPELGDSERELALASLLALRLLPLGFDS